MAIFGPPLDCNKWQRHQPCPNPPPLPEPGAQALRSALDSPLTARQLDKFRRRYPGQRHQIARKAISWQSVSWFTYHAKRRNYHANHPIAQCRFELIGSIPVKEGGKISYSPRDEEITPAAKNLDLILAPQREA